MSVAVEDAEKARVVIEKMRSDPVWFVREVLGEGPWEKQAEILEAVRDHRDVTVRSSYGVGKTFIAARAAVWFLACFENSVVLTTAPNFRQVKHQLWRELRTAHAKSGLNVEAVNKTDLSVGEQWYALGLSTNDPEMFQGFHTDYIFVIVDEASRITPDIYAAVDSVLTSAHAYQLRIGNPYRRSGEFFSGFTEERFKKIHISAFDSPNLSRFGITLDDIRSGEWRRKVEGKEYPYPALVTPDWVAYRWEKWGEDSPLWAVMVMGEFPEQEEGVVIPYSMVQSSLLLDLEEEGPMELGVDPARFGGDKSAFALQQNGKLQKVWTRSGVDEMVVAGEVVKAVRNNRLLTSIKMDTLGVGAGAMDRLREMKRKGEVKELEGVRLAGVKSSRRSRREGYYLLRDELWGYLRELMKSGRAQLIEDEDLIMQLTSRYGAVSDSTGCMQLETKEQMKKRGLGSPDKADAVTMAYWPATGVSLDDVYAPDATRSRHPETAGLMGRRF